MVQVRGRRGRARKVGEGGVSSEASSDSDSVPFRSISTAPDSNRRALIFSRLVSERPKVFALR
jgi:hypothetical protein